MLVKVGNYQIKISNIDKVFWPQEKILKGDLIKYYLEIGEYLLPHLINRPMVMKRFPNGIKGEFFYQKQCPNFAPEWINKIKIKEREMILVNDLATLIWLINLGCIELHPWLSSLNNLHKPDIIVFDLDPEPPAGFRETLPVALIIKDFLHAASLECYPKTSGGEGLHIYVPIKPFYTFDIVRETLKNFCKLLVFEYQDLVTIEIPKVKRKGKVYLDFLQNGFGKTMASVYSIRPRAGAPISTPLTWAEIRAGLDKNEFNIFTIKKRLEQVGDLFAPVINRNQDFTPLVDTLYKV